MLTLQYLARIGRPRRLLVSLVLLVAVVIGPACHDTTGPNGSIVPIPSFTIVSGNAQTARAGSELPQPLVAKATTSTGTPIPGLTVSFVVTEGNGHVYAGTGVTNSSGDVKDFWTLGPVAGAAQKVEVRMVDPTTAAKNSYATFTATATPGPAAIIKISAGDGQNAFTRALVPIKPAALVTDALGNPVSGISVTFAVTAGGGSMSGSPVNTNASGVAAIGSYWRLGRAPGVNKLTASSTGLTGSPATFTATAKFGFAGVGASRNQSCGLSAANDVYCWGENGFGQLGDGSTTNHSVPVRLGGANLLAASLAVGEWYGCLLLSTGKAHCWGYNGTGSLGDGTTTNSSVPVPVAGSLTFTRIAAGYLSTCGLTSSGEVWCWGWNSNGEFGNGNTTQSTVPILGAGGLTFKSIYAGTSHTCALTGAGSAWCWGYNGNGRLGDGTTTAHLSPTVVSGGLTFTSLELGTNHTCGLVAGGKAYCWGYNASGQLGNGSTGDQLSPFPVVGGIGFTQLAAGASQTCGLTSSGVVYCWGYNANGELGIGTIGSAVTLPTLVAGSRRFSSISAGAGHTCGVPAEGGAPLCWGYNGSGQLGNGSTLIAAVPSEVSVPPIP